MYRVIEYFTDLHDDDHEYREGDVFPREGIKVSKERLEELASDKNLRGTPVIELVKEPEKEEAVDARRSETASWTGRRR